jgi:hypothetical protein
MYLDDASSGSTLIGNFFFGAAGGSALKLNGGAHNTVHSTVVVRGAGLGFANCRGIRPPLNYIYTCENPNTGMRWMQTLEDNHYLSPPWSTAFPFLAGWCTNTTAGPRGQLCAPPGAPTGYECASLPRGNSVGRFAGVNMQRNGTFAIKTAPGFPFLDPNSICPEFVVSGEFNDVDFVDGFHFYEEEAAIFVDAAGGDYTLRADSQVFVDFPNFVRVDYRAIGVGGGARL